MPNTYQLEKRTTEEILLFVYGTLMSGMSNNDLLSKSKFIGDVTTQYAKLVDLGYFPGMVEGGSHNEVTGELWEVSEETLEQLDVLEGHPSHFVRSQLVVYSDIDFFVTTRGYKTVRAKKSELVYAYFYNGIKEIPLGDLRQFVEKREGGQG